MGDRRFVWSEKEGMMSGTRVITDTLTGVQYLYAFEGYGGGLVVLVDKDGKPLLDENYVRRGNYN